MENKLKVGDIIVAKCDEYSITSKSNGWIGKILFFNEYGRFTAKTLKDNSGHRNNIFDGLETRCFELASEEENKLLEFDIKLANILELHLKWLRSEKGGVRADLRGTNLSDANLSRADLSDADLSDADLRGTNLSDANLSRTNLRGADLSDADLRGTNLSRADLRGTNLSDADLSDADLRGADLSDADLRGTNLSDANLSRTNLRGADLSDADLRGTNLSRADLSDADLRGTNLSRADLRGADLSDADLRGTNLSDANLSDAEGVLSAIDFMNKHFEKIDEGYIAYKTFGTFYSINPNWKIKVGEVIEENVNFNRNNECGCGINVAPLKWVKNQTGDLPIYKVLIRNEWLMGVCVPYLSDGKIRCERVEILGVVDD